MIYFIDTRTQDVMALAPDVHKAKRLLVKMRAERPDDVKHMVIVGAELSPKDFERFYSGLEVKPGG